MQLTTYGPRLLQSIFNSAPLVSLAISGACLKSLEFRIEFIGVSGAFKCDILATSKFRDERPVPLLCAD